MDHRYRRQPAIFKGSRHPTKAVYRGATTNIGRTHKKIPLKICPMLWRISLLGYQAISKPIKGSHHHGRQPPA